MQQSKCEMCHRRHDCSLRGLAELTRPWVAAAIRSSGGAWAQEQSVGRALRGSGESPGYVEDWILAGAMEQRDADLLVRTILSRGRVEVSDLTQACRHYVGPELDVAA